CIRRRISYQRKRWLGFRHDRIGHRRPIRRCLYRALSPGDDQHDRPRFPFDRVQCGIGFLLTESDDDHSIDTVTLRARVSDLERLRLSETSQWKGAPGGLMMQPWWKWQGGKLVLLQLSPLVFIQSISIVCSAKWLADVISALFVGAPLSAQWGKLGLF